MDPIRLHSAISRDRLPRTRGDGPESGITHPASAAASPHTRGWTRGAGIPAGAHPGFPAHAGMDPGPFRSSAPISWLPRTRGDGPVGDWRRAAAMRASPHTRGWTRVKGSAGKIGRGFPAHAGMDPAHASVASWASWLPRTRGDGPYTPRQASRVRQASPHTRGWTRRRLAEGGGHEGFPAHAGMDPCQGIGGKNRSGLPRTRGDGPRDHFTNAGLPEASPHTRGWTLPGGGRIAKRLGFPAHAGMDPAHPAYSALPLGLPRTRGDGPFSRNRQLPCIGLPRTRGDGPQARPSRMWPLTASPHTRGWTLWALFHWWVPSGFPAHAGMDRVQPRRQGGRQRLPRTRGDGPRAG